jgi:hypothetical protein
MKYVRQLFVLILMAAIISFTPLAGTSALGQKNDNRPPKERTQVKDKDKPPPRNNNNQGNNNRHPNH